MALPDRIMIGRSRTEMALRQRGGDRRDLFGGFRIGDGRPAFLAGAPLRQQDSGWVRLGPVEQVVVQPVGVGRQRLVGAQPDGAVGIALHLDGDGAEPAVGGRRRVRAARVDRLPAAKLLYWKLLHRGGRMHLVENGSMKSGRRLG